MEEIINEWTSELETLSRAFLKHASELAEWDRHILVTRHSLLDLEDELKKVRSAAAPWSALADSVISPTIVRAATSSRSHPRLQSSQRLLLLTRRKCGSCCR